jgi:Na+/proline symporter
LDFYVRLRPQTPEEKKMRLSRLSTFIWATVLFTLAVLSLQHVSRVVEVGLQIASIAYGAMLGVFLLGVLTRRATQYGAMAGMFCGFATEIYLWQFSAVPWTWWVATGTVVTFGVGYAASSFSRARN